MNKTKISWTDYTINPFTGCTPVSPGCDNCYARAMAKRFPIFNNFKITLKPEKLEEIKKIKKPSKIFIGSMGDLFCRDIPEDFIFQVFNACKKAPFHNFQILTKRAGRMAEVADKYYRQEGEWPSNIWLGITCENRGMLGKRTEAVSTLNYPGLIKFISFEPLLENIPWLILYVCVKNFQWIIVGGETGKGARKMEVEWAKEIKTFCKTQEIPFFFKQTGGFGGGSALLEGEKYHNFPVREVITGHERIKILQQRMNRIVDPDGKLYYDGEKLIYESYPRISGKIQKQVKTYESLEEVEDYIEEVLDV